MKCWVGKAGPETLVVNNGRGAGLSFTERAAGTQPHPDPGRVVVMLR